MSQIRTRIVSMLVSCAMLLTLLPLHALAADVSYRLELSSYDEALSITQGGKEYLIISAKVYRGDDETPLAYRQTDYTYSVQQTYTVDYKPVGEPDERYQPLPENVCSGSTSASLWFDLSGEGTLEPGVYTVRVNGHITGTYTPKVDGQEVVEQQEAFDLEGAYTFTLTVAPEITDPVITVNGGEDTIAIDYAVLGDKSIKIPVTVLQDGYDVTDLCQVIVKRGSVETKFNLIDKSFTFFPLAAGVMTDTTMTLQALCGSVKGQEVTLHLTVSNPQAAAFAKVTGESGVFYFSGINEALAAAQSGDTVTLMRDYVVSKQVLIDKDLTLDLGGKTLKLMGSNTQDAILVQSTADPIRVTIENGTISDVRGSGQKALGSNAINIKDAVTLTTRNVTIQAYVPKNLESPYFNYLLRITPSAMNGGDAQTGTLILERGTQLLELPNGGGEHYGVVGVTAIGPYSDGNDVPEDYVGTKVVVKDGVTIETTGYALTGNGASHGTTFVIEGGTLISKIGASIYHPQFGAMTITGNPTITGQNAGIEIRAGKATVSGGTITGLDSPTESGSNVSGTTSSGAGIAVAQHTTKLPIQLTISGGTIQGYSALYESNPQKNDSAAMEKVQLSITGGKFQTTNGGTVAVYSEDKTAFITGGVFSAAPEASYLAQDKYVVTIDPDNGGEKVYAAAGSGYILPDAPTKSGVVFAGWSDGEQRYSAGAAVNVTENLTFTAQWEDAPISGSSGASGNKTETVTNPDGSTTVTVTKPNGTVTETTTDAAGNKTETVTNTDGSSATTVITTDGASSTTTVDQSGKRETQVKLSAAVVDAAQESGETVALPMPGVSASTDTTTAPVVKVELGGSTTAKVEIPVENVTAGTVAVIVKADGTEEVIKTTLTTENGVSVTLSDGDTVKIVDNTKTFEDVADSHWGADAIDFAASRELFQGTSATTFSPEQEMTRAMIVTVLARYEGVDTDGAVWYEAGRQWAMESGISDGSSMDASVSREQLAVMLWRYAGSPVVSDGLSRFADRDTVSDWAAQALAWAVETGLIHGLGDGTLAPQGEATRAQVAAILTRFVQYANQ